MEKDKIFFGENGITTTSANYVANLAKETYRLEEKWLESIRFYSSKIELISSENAKLISRGNSSEELAQIESKLQYIANLKSLIAWLREAIKAKSRLISEAEELSDNNIAKILEIEIPELPNRQIVPSEDDVIATFNIKKRNHYYQLETLCSEIGSYIHQGGHLSDARQNLQDKIANPHMWEGNGQDTIIYSYIPTVSIEEVDSVYFNLQNKYRNYQAELNSLKHEIEVIIQNAQRESDMKFAEDMSIYKGEYNLVMAKIAAYRNEEVAKAQSLKIVIPDSLKETFDKVSKSGKK